MILPFVVGLLIGGLAVFVLNKAMNSGSESDEGNDTEDETGD